MMLPSGSRTEAMSLPWPTFVTPSIVWAPSSGTGPPPRGQV